MRVAVSESLDPGVESSQIGFPSMRIAIEAGVWRCCWLVAWVLESAGAQRVEVLARLGMA